MNLLNMLMSSMTSQSSVNALSKKSGTTADQTGSFISMALPVLINYLTQNASSQNGAQSLAGALTQHTDTSSIMRQFMNADSADGSAIIQHILGGDTSQVVNVLAQQNGMDSAQAESLLDNMAPGLMSELSAATSSAKKTGRQTGGFDFGNLLGMFGDDPSEIAGMFTGGGASAGFSDGGVEDMMGNLMGMLSGNSGSSQGSGMGMLGQLMGMGSGGGFNSGNDGTDLISSLLNMFG